VGITLRKLLFRNRNLTLAAEPGTDPTAAIQVGDEESGTPLGGLTVGVIPVASAADDIADSHFRSAGDATNPILGFGGLTAAFAALKRVGTALYARLADDSGYAPFRASRLEAAASSGSEYVEVAYDQPNAATTLKNPTTGYTDLRVYDTAETFLHVGWSANGHGATSYDEAAFGTRDSTKRIKLQQGPNAGDVAWFVETAADAQHPRALVPWAAGYHVGSRTTPVGFLFARDGVRGGRIKTLTDNTPTGFVTVGLSTSNTLVAGEIVYTVESIDTVTGAMQSETGRARFRVFNVGGVVTASVQADPAGSGDATTIVTTGTLIVTFDAQVSGTNATFRVNSNTSLVSTTTHRLKWRFDVPAGTETWTETAL
jgi:hypothetical protein